MANPSTPTPQFALSARTSRGTMDLDLVPVEQTNAFRGLRRLVLVSSLAAIILAAGTGYLVARTVIAGAVVANGVLVVETGAKQVQSSVAGTIEQLFVREDEKVVAGQPLLALDRTVAESWLVSIETKLVQERARLARLLAERDDLTIVRFPDSFETSMLASDDIAAILETETLQFNLRQQEREGTRAQLREQILQEREAIAGRQVQLDAASEDLVLVADELDKLQQLFDKELIQYQRLSAIQRTLSALKGQQGDLRAAIASGRGRVAELELKILQVDQSMRATVTEFIAVSQQTIAQLVQEQTSTLDVLAKSVLTAPQSGVVHQLAVHTLGGVVQPAEVLMLIVPEDDRLVGEVRIRPADIDQLYPGQGVSVQFSAFDRGTTPALDGELNSVSPDLSTDPQTGAIYYSARIGIDTAELARLGDLRLVPGMPMEVYIRTSDRTLLSYLTKPLTDQMERALR